MKLRNKKTGEIVEADFNSTISGRTNIIIIQNGPEQLEYGSLADLNEEWEDFNGYYYIDDGGDVNLSRTKYILEHEDEASKEIGNYFETKEEAEKAVEKLKAWKRLKDNGFKFLDYTSLGVGEIKFEHNVMDEIEDVEQLEKDLDLLFGGEDGN